VDYCLVDQVEQEHCEVDDLADELGDFFIGALIGGAANVALGIVGGFFLGKAVASGGFGSSRARAFRGRRL
jgi:hypothetical protein